MEEKKLVAVYGSLRKGLYNHFLIKDSKYIGEFDTEPIYDMYSLTSYPGLVTDGNTSIKMEVYEVDKITLNRLNTLEGYRGDNNAGNHYNRITIETPYGDAYTYTYNYNVSSCVKVDCGDWKIFRDHLEAEMEKRRRQTIGTEKSENSFEARHSIE